MIYQFLLLLARVQMTMSNQKKKKTKYKSSSWLIVVLAKFMSWLVLLCYDICIMHKLSKLLKSLISVPLFLDIYSNHDNIQGSSRRRQNMGSTISFEKLQNSSQEMMLLNRDVSKKQTFGLRR